MVDGVQHPTFLDAARERGLLLDDREVEESMTEAADHQMPAQLRHTFAVFLAYSVCADPARLWMQHKAAMCEDLVYRWEWLLCVKGGLGRGFTHMLITCSITSFLLLAYQPLCLPQPSIQGSA